MFLKNILRKTAFLVGAAIGLCESMQADEGMWIPLLLQQNQEQMQRLGLRLTAEDIYSVNHSSLKDAIVIFGGGCTGEVVSEQGLVLTNHHCGYGYIQAHSTVEHDYLTNGFWAAEMKDELPCPGLAVRFLKEMEDVSHLMLEGLDENISENARRDSISVRSGRLVKEREKAGFEVRVVPFYYGNQYYMFVYEVFKDVRLVGAPPSNIGKFGGDTDNWMWPRHTGDFSVFRIYADADNKPAPYSPDNKPYKPVKHLKIDLRGYEEGDFTFVFGYPGRTQEYLSSFGVKQILEQEDPMRIAARTARLEVIKAAMEKDPAVRIQYAAKAASIANGWKKWIGEAKGIRRLNVIGSKQDYEKIFEDWTQSGSGKVYAGVLPALQKAYGELASYQSEAIVFQEHILAAEAVGFAYSFKKLCLVSKGEETGTTMADALAECNQRAEKFFKDYNADVDRAIFEKMCFMTHADGSRTQIIDFPDMRVEKAMDLFYGKSLFTDRNRLQAFLQNYKTGSCKEIEKDPLFKYADEAYGHYLHSVRPRVLQCQKRIDSLQRLYMKGQMLLKESGDFAALMRVGAKPVRNFSNVGSEQLYPDANFTLRVTYGKVAGFSPADAVQYRPYTTIEGIMQKEDPDIYDYVVEDRLKALYAAKDYGRYANALGEMPVAFVGTNHTTGGNSGSPVLNGDGNLIGINFDRCWEGTMSDIRYDAQMCRNIMLDIRYCLFIIDKFAGATRLVEEMDIIE